ncbi:hypothetical protein J6590_045368 [Homalodisca vitripennis]|nr:hypothetical protein J6590_045368 [Homalodisca vitripennis]
MVPALVPGSLGTRNLKENISDLKAQIAANQKKRITDLEKTSAEDLHSYKEIIELLQKELEDSSSQNDQLKQEIKHLKEYQIKLPKKFQKYSDSVQNTKDDPINSTNRFQPLETNEMSLQQEISQVLSTSKSDSNETNKVKQSISNKSTKLQTPSTRNFTPTVSNRPKVLLLADSHGWDMGMSHTKILVSALPYRHDVPGLNNRIAFINMELQDILSKYPDATFLPINNLQRHMYTKHGLHFNRTGKQEISRMVIHLVCREKDDKKMKESRTIKEKKHEKSKYSVTSGTGIEILQEDMWEVINNLRTNSSVAFAHTISGDFHHPRRMTAGVAVTFARQFGKPKIKDRLSKFLAFQRENPQEAAVYSLITKEHYYGKPTEEDYNQAFLELTQDFKKRTLSTLVCSPMGCARDNVEIGHFVKNIKEFQRATGAAVIVITKDQPGALRPLHRGLSFEAFLKKLKEEIQKPNLSNQSSTASTSLPVQSHPTTKSFLHQNKNQSFLANLDTFPPLI